MLTMTKDELEQLYKLTEKFNETDDIRQTIQAYTLEGNPHRTTHRNVTLMYQTMVHQRMQAR